MSSKQVVLQKQTYTHTLHTQHENFFTYHRYMSIDEWYNMMLKYIRANVKKIPWFYEMDSGKNVLYYLYRKTIM